MVSGRKSQIDCFVPPLKAQQKPINLMPHKASRGSKGQKMKAKRRTIIIVLAIAAVCSCSQRKMAKTGFLSDYSKLQAVSDSSLRYLDKRALATYSSFMVDTVEVHFQAGAKAIETKSKGKLTQQDVADLTNYFHTTLVKLITGAGFEVVFQPGPGVARIRTAITDIEETDVLLAAVPTVRIATNVGAGGASVEMEIVDSQTGRQIGAALERRAGSRIPFTGLSDWGGAKAAIDNWAERVKQRLEEGQSK